MSLLSFAPLHGDEIKLKSGETITNCKVKKKKKGRWTVILLDGSRRIIKESNVASHVEKPTLGDSFDERIKKAGKKDKEAFLAIGREAMAAGAKLQAVKALKKVTRLDKNNEEAHELLGDEKCADGKWRNGRALVKYKTKKKEDDLKARGWKKVKGKWVDPLTAANLKAGLVQYKGKWYTKDHAGKLKSGKIYNYGSWYEASDQEKLEKGLVRYKGKWLKEREANAQVRENGDAWSLVGDHFIVIGAQGRKNLIICLQHLDDTWEAMASLYGGAPSTAKKEDKIVVYVAKNANGYGVLFGQNGGDDRCSYFSSAGGGAYCSRTGVVVTYYYNLGYLVQWTQAAGACAFQAKLLGYDNCPSNFYDAFACYIQGFSNGRYTGYNEMSFNGFRGWSAPGDPLTLFADYDLSVKLKNGAANETRFNRLGFVLHYLKQKHPKVLETWISMVRAKKGDTKSLVKKARAMLKDVDLAKEFATFVNQYNATYSDPPIELRK